MYASTGIGTGDAGEEMEYVRKWEEKYTAVLCKAKEELEGRIGEVKSNLRLPLIQYDNVKDLRLVSDEEIDPSSAHGFVVGGNGCCAYAMRFRSLFGLDAVFVDVYFSLLPDWRVREGLKTAVRRILVGEKDLILPVGRLGEHAQGKVDSLHVVSEVRAAPKSVGSVMFTLDGIRGDFSPWRAMGRVYDLLVLPREALGELNSEGWPVRPGDLGENVTTEGFGRERFVLGTRFRIGGAEIIVSGSRRMDNLVEYEHGAVEHLRSLPYVGDRWPQFQQAVSERLGIFALVITEGTVKKGETMESL